jgi:hypothetical protein
MNKTAAIFATLKARYGIPTLKDGQEIQAVAQSYESALGAYALTDLSAACVTWMSSSKWPRWPEPAELLEILRSFGAKPETTKRLEMSPRTRDAANDASNWYRNLIARPLIDGAFPFSWMDALNDVIGVGKPEHLGRSFAWLLTHAWLQGDIPGSFDQKAALFFSRAHNRKDAYHEAVRQHGVVAVNERRVNF